MDEPLRILALDRDADFLRNVSAALESGFFLHAADDLASAVEQLSRQRFSVMLLSLEGGGWDAAELCSRLARSHRLKPLEIVLTAAEFEEGALRRALTAGADDFLVKSAGHGEIRLRLKAAVVRLRQREKTHAERDFYRQAVQREEELSSRLLDKQMGLQETLAEVVQKKRGLENENRRLAAAARYDALSGLLNRQSLNARLELEARKAAEEDAPLCGVMMDIDRFKAINDSHGHLVGDEVIRVMGDALREVLRRGDFAGRYGGEEFFLILPGATLDVALLVAERVRNRINALRVALPEAQLAVTASIGVSPYRKGQSVAEWVGAADAAMYRAKQYGRNRIEA